MRMNKRKTDAQFEFGPQIRHKRLKLSGSMETNGVDKTSCVLKIRAGGGGREDGSSVAGIVQSIHSRPCHQHVNGSLPYATSFFDIKVIIL